MAVQAAREELKKKLEQAEVDKNSHYLRTTAEIDDLYRTKSTLEERLIELIKYALGLPFSSAPALSHGRKEKSDSCTF